MVLNSSRCIHKFLVFFAISLLLINAACTPQAEKETVDAIVPSTEAETVEESIADQMVAAEYPLFGLCDLEPDLVGETLRVEGRITYLDDASPDGIYFDVQEADCQAGVWLDGDALASLSVNLQNLLVMDGRISVIGVLAYEEGEYFLDYLALGEAQGNTKTALDPTEKWWLKPQTYHAGEGPDVDLIMDMNITVLHDWGALTWGFANDPDPYWSAEMVQERWNRAHALGMRVEAVLSTLDMWFVEYGPGDEVYASSAIDLNGDHIVYADPVGFVGCTNQHGWQEFTRHKIFKAIDWGADGIIIDDYEGSSRWTSGVPNGMGGLENGPGGCFCSACESGFREYLREKYTTNELLQFGVEDIDNFDYSEYLLERGWTIEKLGEESRKFQGWDSNAEIIVSLYQDYADFQNQEIVEFLEILKQESLAYAHEQYGREISWGVNAGELTYGAHKIYPLFDQAHNVGAIWQFGYPPKGADGFHYRLGFSIFGTPRLREVFRDPVVVAVMNEYQTNDLWLLKSAEAYANLGALIEYDYITIEGASDEVAYTSLTNDAEAKGRYNTFYLEHPAVSDFVSLSSLAQTAVLYSSPSVHHDMNRHISSFNGIGEILTDLNVQFDPLFIGDGIITPDFLSQEMLSQYDLVFLPDVYALTEKQGQALLEFMRSGGSVVALGDFAVVDEEGEPFTSQEILSLIAQGDQVVGSGQFKQLRIETFRADGVVDDYFKNIAAIFFENYIENNHPAVEQFLAQVGDEVKERIGEATAANIRSEILGVVHAAFEERVVEVVSAENIAAQIYQRDEPRQIILHLLNYNYDLRIDTVYTQEDIEVEVALPKDMHVSQVSLISPDLEGDMELEYVIEDGIIRFTVPSLYIWDVIILE